MPKAFWAHHRPHRLRKPHCFRPCLEVLEDRVVPSGIVTIPVTSTLDAPNYPTTITFAQLQAANFANVTLTDAINAANNDTNGQKYIIQLQPTTYLTGINPDNGWYGGNAFPAITSNITIQGNGATINRTPHQTNPMRFFFVAGETDLNPGLSPGSLTLEDLTLENGQAQGGGSALGGGGLGAGGAIFNLGSLSLVGVTLSSNQAIGGSSGGDAGNGGGGMGANSDFTDNGGGFGGGFNDAVASIGGLGGSQGGGGGGGPDSSNGSSGSGAVGVGGSDPTLPSFFSGGEGGVTSGSVDGIGANGGNFGSGGFANGGGGGGGGIGGGGGATRDPNGSRAGSGGFGGGGGGVTAPGPGADSGPGNAGLAGFGGFGGGGGGFISGDGGAGGSAGFGGGDGNANSGGGGAGMGGAIFNFLGGVQVIDSTLTGNTAQGGAVANSSSAGNGAGMGGGIFNLDGAVQIADSTIAFNNALTGASASGSTFPSQTSDGGAIYNLALDMNSNGLQTATVTLSNSILSNSNSQSTEGVFDLSNNSGNSPGNTATVTGSTNLIMRADDRNTDGGGGNVSGTGGGGVGAIFASTADPLLGPLQNNGGPTPTMAIDPNTPAFGIGDTAALNTLVKNGVFPLDTTGNPVDQRGLPRIDPSRGKLDLGAFEVQALAQIAPTTTTVSPATVTFSPNAQQVTVSAQVTTSGRPVTGGTVSFSITDANGTVLAQTTTPVTVDINGNASTTLTLPAALPVLVDGHSNAQYTITGSYSPATPALSPSSMTAPLTVNPAAPLITADPATTIFHTAASTVLLQAHVRTAQGTGVAEGQLTFFFGNQTLVGVNDGNGNFTALATIAAGTQVGSQSFTVSYTDPFVPDPNSELLTAGDFTGGRAESTLTITPAPTSTHVDPLVIPFSTTPTKVVLTAEVTSPEGIVPDGTVNFTILDAFGNPINVTLPMAMVKAAALLQGAPSASVMDGVASVTVLLPAGLPAGSYQVLATYTPSANGDFLPSRMTGPLSVNGSPNNPPPSNPPPSNPPPSKPPPSKLPPPSTPPTQLPIFPPVVAVLSDPGVVPAHTTPAANTPSGPFASTTFGTPLAIALFVAPTQGGSAPTSPQSEALIAPASAILFVQGLADGPQAISIPTSGGDQLDRPLDHVRMKALRLGASVTEGDDSVGLVEKLLAAPPPGKPPVVPAPPPAPAPAPKPGAATPPKQQSRLPWLVLPWVALCGVVVPWRARSRRAKTERNALE
jgi:hypothetical protein